MTNRHLARSATAWTTFNDRPQTPSEPRGKSSRRYSLHCRAAAGPKLILDWLVSRELTVDDKHLRTLKPDTEHYDDPGDARHNLVRIEVTEAA
jgi:hypothetical protein